MTHHAADCDVVHDPETDVTRCYNLDADHTTVAHILGHDTHRPDHVRLTAAQHGQIDELVGWAKSQDADSRDGGVARTDANPVPGELTWAERGEGFVTDEKESA